MVQQKPSLPIILDSPPPSILAYWRDNGYKLMKPLSVAVTRGWVGTQTLHHPVTLINQAPSSPPSLPPDWRTARGCNATLRVWWGPTLSDFDSASFIYAHSLSACWLCWYQSPQCWLIWKVMVTESLRLGKKVKIVSSFLKDKEQFGKKFLQDCTLTEYFHSNIVLKTQFLVKIKRKRENELGGTQWMTSKTQHSASKCCLKPHKNRFPPKWQIVFFGLWRVGRV